VILETIAARLTLELIPEAEITSIATALIQSGHDCPQLRGLAAAGGGDPSARRSLLTQAVTACGGSIPEESAAVSIMIRSLSWDIFHGTIPPYFGARQLAALRPRRPADSILRQFTELAGEWNDAPSHRPDTERRIEDLARLVLAGSASA
jgi:hypothetical protein